MLDGFPDYSVYEDAHMIWTLDAYRKIYADAMIEITGADGVESLQLTHLVLGCTCSTL